MRTLISVAASAALAPMLAAAPSADLQRDAVADGVRILLDGKENFDRTDGHTEWPYEGVYRVRGDKGRAVIPLGYRIGGTSICGWSLIEVPGYADDKNRQAAIAEALDFIFHALDDERMGGGFRRGYDVRGWGHAYALTFLSRLQELGFVPEGKADAVKAEIQSLTDLLQEGEIENTGGWNYSRRGRQPQASSFMTGSAVQALLAAKSAGAKVDPKVIERGLGAIEASRLETGAYQYSLDPDSRTGKGFEAVPGATGRMPICETTLLLAGRGSTERLRESIEAFYEHWEWLEKRRKGTGTHIPPYMIAPYYFYYAHYYAAQAIQLLPEAERKKQRARLLELLFKVREENGAWNDRVFERSQNFGTAMVMLALLEPHAQPKRKWATPADS